VEKHYSKRYFPKSFPERRLFFDASTNFCDTYPAGCQKFYSQNGAILEKFILENWRRFEVRFDGLFWILEKI
jgi:hypothetical protein